MSAEEVFISLANEEGKIEKEKFVNWYNEKFPSTQPKKRGRPPASTSTSTSTPTSTPISTTTPTPTTTPTTTPTKKARTPSNEPVTDPAFKMTAVARASRLKTLVSDLKKSIKSKKFYAGYDARPNECVAEVSLSPAEYHYLFDAFGALIPASQPHSKVINRTYTSYDLTSLFGTTISSLKSQCYSMPRNFSKQHKCGSQPISLLNASSSYSLNSERVKFKFTCLNQPVSDYSSDDMY